MKHLKDVAIITGNLASIIGNYVKEFRQNGEGFEEFSDESIIYSLLEYSKFPRDFSRQQRIIYIHSKCLEYEGKNHIYIKVEFDEQHDRFIIISSQKKDKLPF